MLVFWCREISVCKRECCCVHCLSPLHSNKPVRQHSETRIREQHIREGVVTNRNECAAKNGNQTANLARNNSAMRAAIGIVRDLMISSARDSNTD